MSPEKTHPDTKDAPASGALPVRHSPRKFDGVPHLVPHLMAGVVLFPHVGLPTLILGVFLLVILVGLGLLWLVLAELDAAHAVSEADLFGDPPPRDGDTWSRKAPAATPVAQDWPEDCAS